jgi:hypothetical protein
VPRRALTAGMSTILAARRIILVVSGGPKRAILRELLLGPITPELPASFLRQFPMATLIVDEDAWPEDVARADRETAPHGGSETPEKVGSGSSPSGSSGPGSSAPGSSASAASGTAAASAPSGAERVGGHGRPQ